MHERRLAGLEVTELEQGIVGGAERHRDTGCLLGREGGRDRPAEPFRCCAQLGVRAVHPNRHHPVTRAQPGDLVADSKDGTGALVPHDLGGGGDFVARPVQRVAALDADRLDSHEHPVGGHGGIGDILVAEDLGAARVVVDRGLHVCSCPVG
jgi:hypothetical protein